MALLAFSCLSNIKNKYEMDSVYISIEGIIRTPLSLVMLNPFSRSSSTNLYLTFFIVISEEQNTTFMSYLVTMSTLAMPIPELFW